MLRGGFSTIGGHRPRGQRPPGEAREKRDLALLALFGCLLLGHETGPSFRFLVVQGPTMPLACRKYDITLLFSCRKNEKISKKRRKREADGDEPPDSPESTRHAVRAPACKFASQTLPNARPMRLRGCSIQWNDTPLSAGRLSARPLVENDSRTIGDPHLYNAACRPYERLTMKETRGAA